MLFASLLSLAVLASAARLDVRTTKPSCPAPQTINGRICTSSCGVDRPGGDYKSLKTGNFNDCIKACASDPVCLTAQYHKDNGYCYLKNSVNAKKTDANDDTVDCQCVVTSSKTVTSTTTATSTTSITPTAVTTTVTQTAAGTTISITPPVATITATTTSTSSVTASETTTSTETDTETVTATVTAGSARRRDVGELVHTRKAFNRMPARNLARNAPTTTTSCYTTTKTSTATATVTAITSKTVPASTTTATVTTTPAPVSVTVATPVQTTTVTATTTTTVATTTFTATTTTTTTITSTTTTSAGITCSSQPAAPQVQEGCPNGSTCNTYSYQCANTQNSNDCFNQCLDDPNCIEGDYYNDGTCYYYDDCCGNN